MSPEFRLSVICSRPHMHPCHGYVRWTAILLVFHPNCFGLVFPMSSVFILERVWTLVCGLATKLNSVICRFANQVSVARLSLTIQLTSSYRVINRQEALIFVRNRPWKRFYIHLCCNVMPRHCYALDPFFPSNDLPSNLTNDLLSSAPGFRSFVHTSPIKAC